MMSTGVPNATGVPSSMAHNQQATNICTGSVPSSTPRTQKPADISTDTGNSSELGIESTDYQTAAGLNLGERQKVLVGSVLDLFAGKPSLKKLSLWTDDATFNDPLTKSAGRKQYSAQWYGLAAAFSEIERISCSVKDTGNPIIMNMKTRYKVKGLGTEKVIESVVKIFTDVHGENIVGVEDRWSGNIPEGAIAKVFRNLNAATVPAFVRVPKNGQEEAAKK